VNATAATGERIVTCHQPTYLPWPGLFHKLRLADVFVVLDTVGYSRYGWQNRTLVKGTHGPFWLSVPLVAATRSRPLTDLAISHESGPWQQRHWTSLRLSYSGAPYWRRYAPLFEDVLLGRVWTSVVELNLEIIRRMMPLFGLEVTMVRTSELGWGGRKSDLILDQCRRTSASVYVSGVNGQDYLLESAFLTEGISVFYQRYRPPVYRQRFGDFAPGLSSVDLLFHEGDAAAEIMFRDNVDRESILTELRTHGAPAVVQTRSAADAEPDGVTARGALEDAG
jgi:hypothetical protein